MLTATGSPHSSQYAFYWDYRQRTRSFYVGKVLPSGVKLCIDTNTDATNSNIPATKEDVLPDHTT